MEISTLAPEERVFRIDDECYIIYLGTDRDDLKPFLRIGNSRRITPYVIKGTYNIVITDSVTGNPALEPENMNRENSRENRYVGDRKITASLQKFIQQFNIENGSVSTIEDVQKAHKRAEVHFFDDGNIHIFFDRNILFDLRKREKNDLHFIERAHMLKDIHTKNPLRYRADDLQMPGFMLLERKMLLFDRGKATALGLPDYYFIDFVNAGIDPDIIDTVVTDDIGGSFFKLLKRKWNTRKKLRILTGNTELVRSAAALLTHTGAGALHTDISSFQEGQKRTASGFRLERNSRGLVARHKDLILPIAISETASSEQGLWTLNPTGGFMLQRGKPALPLPEGVLHQFVKTVPEYHALLQTYIHDVYALIEDDLVPSESMVAKLIDQLMEDVQQRPAQSMMSRVRKGLKKLKLSEHSELYYFLNNAHGIISILLERAFDKDKKKGLESGDEADGVQYFAPLRDMLRKKLRSMQSVRTQLPIRGDFYPLGEATVLLYGPVKGANSRDAYAFTRGLVEDLDRKAASFQEELDREFARLHALLFELQGEEADKTKAGKKALIAGKLSGMPEGVTLPKIGEVGGTRKDTASKEATTAEERQAYTTAPVQHVSYSRGLSGPFKLIIPAAVVAIAALLLILFFFFPQVIGRRKPGEMGDTDIAATQEAVTEQDEGSFEADEFLEEKGIPQSALTDRMTVIYRGRIEITILDIFLLTNEIAVTNGFRRLDSIEETGRDPDWIYPENLFVLPDSTRYTVVKGDTMWYIAHRFIIKRLEEDWDRYMSIKNEAETTTPDAQRKEILIRELKSIGARSYSENFRREIDSVLETL